MAEKNVHLALRRVHVGRGDGWRVWMGLLDCCYCVCARDVDVSMAIEDWSSLGLCVRLVSSDEPEHEK